MEIDVYEGIKRFKEYEDKILHNGRIRFRYAKEYPIDDRVDISEEDIKNLCKKLEEWSSVTKGCEPAFILTEDYNIFGIIKKKDCYRDNYEFFIVKNILSWEEARDRNRKKKCEEE